MLGVLIALCYFGVRNHTLTYDEAEHYKYGTRMLAGNSNRFDDSKMPFSALNALAGTLSGAVDAEAQARRGRLATILFAAGAAYLAFCWSRALYGAIPALFTLFLYTFEPNLLAHSQLVTTDIYAAGMVLATCYAAWRFSRERNGRAALLLALAISVAQLSKYTAIFLYGLIPGLLLIHDLPALGRLARQRAWGALGRYAGGAAGLAALMAVVGILVINAGFLFNRSLTPLGEYAFQSELFQSLQQSPWLKGLPAPLPYPYLEGLDLVRFRERSGWGYGKIYLLGELRSEQGFPGYYLVAWLFKVPLAIQVALLLAAWAYWRRKPGRKFWDDEWFLVGPVLFFGLYFNFFYRAQIGIRYLLVIFPLVLILCANLLSGWAQLRRGQKLGALGLALYLVISVFSYYPHLIPYFNELLIDRKLAYKILADSNLDWGQADGYVRAYMANHPEAILAPEEPVGGVILISPNSLLGISVKPNTYRWLRENFRPSGTIAYSYLVFEVSPEALERIRK